MPRSRALDNHPFQNTRPFRKTTFNERQGGFLDGFCEFLCSCTDRGRCLYYRAPVVVQSRTLDAGCSMLQYSYYARIRYRKATRSLAGTLVAQDDIGECWRSWSLPIHSLEEKIGRRCWYKQKEHVARHRRRC